MNEFDKDKIWEAAKAAGLLVHQLGTQKQEDAFYEFARLVAADRQEAVPIYQTCFMNGQWRDVDRFEHDRAKSLRSDLARIVYAAPSPAAREAGDGVRLTDADRLKWLREHHFSTLTNEEIDQQIAADAALLREAGSR